ncbi:MAG: hypothetical protein JEZ12_01975 [Desulfobacterium sp.]|nr:hypothetical protein [Desulfobacterium sp.]
MDKPIKFIELLEYGEEAGLMAIGHDGFEGWARKRGIATEGNHAFHWDFLQSWIKEAFVLINPKAKKYSQAHVMKGEYHSLLVAHRSLQEARKASKIAICTAFAAVGISFLTLLVSIGIGYKQLQTPVTINPEQIASIKYSVQTTQAAYEHQKNLITLQALNDISNAIDKSLLASQATYDKQADKTIQALNDIAQILKELKDSRQIAGDATDGTTQDPKQVEHTPSPEKAVKGEPSRS